MTITLHHELSKDDLFALLAEADFSAPEKRRVLELLFPSRNYTDNARLVADIADFIYKS